MKNIKGNLFFYIAYTIFVFSNMFNNVNGISDYVDILSGIGLGAMCMICLIPNVKYKIKDIIILIISLIILILSWYFSRDTTLVKAFIMILAIKNVETKKIIKYDLIIRIIFFLTIIMLYNLNMTNSYFMYRNGQIRSSMGFAHPNVFGIYLLIICLDIICLNLEKMKLRYYILFIFISYIVGYFSDSRTTQICFMLIVLLCMIYKYKSGRIFENRVVKFMIVNLFIICTFISLILGYLYNPNNAIGILDKTLSRRIEYTSVFLKDYKINLFGNEWNTISSREAMETHQTISILDNSYVYILLRYGVVTYVLILCIVRKVFIKLLKDKEYSAVIILILYTFIGLTETYLFKIQVNPFLLCTGKLIYDYSKRIS